MTKWEIESFQILRTPNDDTFDLILYYDIFCSTVSSKLDDNDTEFKLIEVKGTSELKLIMELILSWIFEWLI